MARSRRVAAAVGAVGLQLVVLYAPRAPAIATGALPVDKLVHALVFALPTVALIAAGLPRGWVIGVMAVHAPLSEVVQNRMLADRSGDPWDVVADLAGVAVGAFLTRRVRCRSRRASPRSGAPSHPGAPS